MEDRIVSDARRVMLAKVRQARRMTEEARVLAGPQLFARACELIKQGLRHDHPGLDDDAIHQKLLQCLKIHSRLDHKRRLPQ